MTLPALALGLSSFCFEGAAAVHVCQAYVMRMGEVWCEDEFGPYRCVQIRPPEDVACIVTDHIAQAAHDPAPGEALVIWIRAMENGVASPVCTHDGGPLDCGTVELIGESEPCP